MGSTQSRRYSSSSDFSDSSGTITPEIKTHSSHPLPNALILDLGDVLFTWSLPTLPTLSPSVFKKITRSSIWFEYEKGNLTEHDAYAAVAEEFCVTPSAVAEAFQQARESLKPNLEFLALVMQLKKEHGLKVFAMSNISAPDWEFLRNQATPEQWAVFDRVFTSAEMGERKPNLGFYRRVLEAAGVDPERTVFVDDKPENVLSARSLGVKGVVFTNSRDVGRELKNFFGDPAARAKEWLRCNAGKMQSVTNSGVVLEENFAQFMIWEITGNRELVDVGRWARLVCFFKGDGVLTTAEFPCDLDTTSIAMTVAGAEVEEEMKNSVMDEMLTYKNKDDIIQTYFDVSRPRIGIFFF